jgi:hypothetical protein
MKIIDHTILYHKLCQEKPKLEYYKNIIRN